MKLKILVIFLVTFIVVLSADTVWRGTHVRSIGTGEEGAPPPPPPPVDSAGAEWWSGADQIGGGPGYSDTICYTLLSNNHSSSWIVTANGSPEDSLESFLSSASTGDTIYVMDTVEIDMSGYTIEQIKAGAILASGRGTTKGDTISWGALLYDGGTPCHYLSEAIRINAGARMTGFRVRGWFNEEGGLDGSVSFNYNTRYGIIKLKGDEVELDNCEIWGTRHDVITGEMANNDTSYIHHCYFHDGAVNDLHHILMTNTDTDHRLICEANYFDDGRSAVMVEGTNTDKPNCEFRYNITGEHGVYNHYDHHGKNESSPPTTCGPDWIHNNTMQATHYTTGPTSIWIRGNPTDSFIVENNWLWPADSATAVGFSYGSTYENARISDNEFTTTLPDGLAYRIPTAAIVSDVDSGTVPLTVKFKVTGSSAGDDGGSLIAFYWKFGDHHTARFTDVTDSVSHEFDSIGVYRVEVMAVNEIGAVDKAYKDIKVKPDDDHVWLSAWVRDNFSYSTTGNFKKRVYLESGEHTYLVWEDDIAMYDGWQHVVVDVDDSISDWGCDSVDLIFGVYCTANNSPPEKLRFSIDDVYMFGGTVVNGNFESGSWSGRQQATTDGYWQYSSNGSKQYGYDESHYVRSGIRAFWCQSYNGVNGNYSRITQTVDILGQ